MGGHLLGVLEPPVVLQINRDAGRPPGVTSDRGEIDYAVLDPDGMAKARRFAPEADIERPNGRLRRG